MRRLFAAVLLASLGCGLAVPADDPRLPNYVSLVRLLASPQEFDDRLVLVYGVPQIEFEGNALYLYKEDFVWGLYTNAVWMDVPAESWKDWKRYSGKYVAVEGTFNAQRHGHNDMFGGTLERITRFNPVHR
jgi:hypothetical protein